jgi:flagellin
MGLFVNHNPPSIRSGHQLSRIHDRLQQSTARLSSGSRIPSASADAAGLMISEALRAQVASLGQSSRNAYDGVSVAQTAEGSLGEISDILGRLQELSVQAGNDTLSDADRETLQNEAADLISQIDQIARSSDFNGINLLDGSVSSLSIDVGGGADGHGIQIALDSVTSESLGLSGFDLGPGGDRGAALSALSQAADSVGQFRARLGSSENRLSSSIRQVDQQITSLTDAESRIRDADIAHESAQRTQLKIQAQATLAIHAQANLQPKSVLSLLTA